MLSKLQYCPHLHLRQITSIDLRTIYFSIVTNSLSLCLWHRYKLIFTHLSLSISHFQSLTIHLSLHVTPPPRLSTPAHPSPSLSLFHLSSIIGTYTYPVSLSISLYFHVSTTPLSSSNHCLSLTLFLSHTLSLSHTLFLSHTFFSFTNFLLSLKRDHGCG